MLIRMASIAVASLSLLSSGTFAGTSTNAVILTLGLDNGAPNVLFIRMDRPKDSGTQAPCHDNSSWSYVRPLTSPEDKNVYAMLLAAKASGSSITLIGTTECGVYGGIETLHAVHY